PLRGAERTHDPGGDARPRDLERRPPVGRATREGTTRAARHPPGRPLTSGLSRRGSAAPAGAPARGAAGASGAARLAAPPPPPPPTVPARRDAPPRGPGPASRRSRRPPGRRRRSSRRRAAGHAANRATDGAP